MDNLCHTLVGAALGEAGLKRRTRFGNVALMVSANLPDLDVLVFGTDTLPVAFRRGWTHGVAAQLALPAALALIFVLVARWRPDAQGARPTGKMPIHAGWLLVLSYIGVYSHVLLDYLNNYGVRLLAPLDWRWFYGDAVFIIDPWLWLALGAGVWLSRRQGRTAPARGALTAAICYIAIMLLSAYAARHVVETAWRSIRGIAPPALMVGPVVALPFEREIIVDAGNHYETGELTWSWPPAVTFFPSAVPKNSARPEVAAAIAGSERLREFLVWSRFPFWTVTPTDHGTVVTVQDMRFRNRGAAFAVSTTVAPR